MRASKTVNGVKSTFEYVGGKLVYEKRGNMDIYYQYDSNGNLSAIRYDDGTVDNIYYAVCNSRGDVEALYGGGGGLKARYIYDTWGNTVKIVDVNGKEITDKNTVGYINPIRYRGYYYDTETGFYYLQSRYYDPETGRFLNADGYVSTGQGVLSTNMFAYCGNNPVNMVDESGKSYSKAYNEAIKSILVAAQIGANILTSVASKSKKSNSNVSKSSKSNKSVKSDTKKQLQIRDVTHEINFALKPYVIEAEAMKNLANAVPLYKPYVYGTFGLLVNHNSVWDIKRQIPWEKTIGTTFPGYGVPVIYGGIIMTPEALGNYTYGYLGAAFGFSYQTLIDGSVGAAGLPRSIPGIENETNDWNYITMGYLNYYF